MTYSTLPTDRLTLRGPQAALVDAACTRAARGDKTTVGLLATGAGKTLAWQATHIVGHRAGLWTHVAVFSPRLNLARQAEQDWRGTWGPRFAQPRPKPVSHRGNDVSLTPRGSSGYVSTYQSLVANVEHHMTWAAKHDGEFLLVLDEAQFLGVDGDESTQAALAIAEMSKHAAHVLVLTGTPYRSDGKPLLLCDEFYVPLDDNPDRIRLDAHVEALYQDCVAEKTLRKFQADLVDGDTSWVETTGGQTFSYDLPITAVEDLLSRALRDERVWEPIVDRVVERLDEVRDKVHVDHASLIACMDVQHAREVHAYALRVAPHLRVGIAVSADGAQSRKVLDATRAGEIDLLVSVRQAYIGFDHKPITVIGVLTHYRHHGHLEQLVGRALRAWPAVPFDDQACYVVGPADPQMRRFAETMRTHGDNGVRIAERDEDAEAVEGGERVEREVHLLEAEMQGGRTYGHQRDGVGDLTAEQAEAMRLLMRDRAIEGVSEATAAALLRAAGVDLTSALAPYMDDVEVESVRYSGMTLSEARRTHNKEVSALLSGWMHRNGVDRKSQQARLRDIHGKLNRALGVKSSSDIVEINDFDARYQLAVEYVDAR